MDAAARPEDAVLADIGERHRTQIEVDLIAELFPQIVGETSGAIASAADRRAGSAAGGAYRLVDRQNNVGNPGLAAVVRQQITAARAAHALDEPILAQHREELLEVGQRDFLPFGDFGERDRVATAVLGKIDHCHHRVASLGAQPHFRVLKTLEPSSIAVSAIPAGAGDQPERRRLARSRIESPPLTCPFLLEFRQSRPEARDLVEQSIEGAGDRVRYVAANGVGLERGFGLLRVAATANRARRDTDHRGAIRHL